MPRWCKLAILTDEVSQDLDTVIRFAKEFSLDGIEVRSLFGRAFKDLTEKDLSEIAMAASDAGLAIAGASSPVFKCDLDSDSQIADHVDLFKRSVEAAQVLGTDIVRVFAFLRRSHPATSDDLKRAASHFPKLLDIVRGTNIRVGLENEASCIVASGPETKEFLSHLAPDPQLTVVWDPCNVIYLSGTNDPVKDDFPLIADRVGHVHFKDAKRPGDQPAPTCLELGTGQIDFPGQLAALKSRGYNSWIALETHWRTVPLDAETQHLPAGYGFSANAEPASRICMSHLQRWIDEA
ncbi:MAG: sugar phosphate isomerase/epimerase family protein [Chthoniobacteraceae bacterium]